MRELQRGDVRAKHRRDFGEPVAQQVDSAENGWVAGRTLRQAADWPEVFQQGKERTLTCQPGAFAELARRVAARAVASTEEARQPQEMCKVVEAIVLDKLRQAQTPEGRDKAAGEALARLLLRNRNELAAKFIERLPAA